MEIKLRTKTIVPRHFTCLDTPYMESRIAPEVLDLFADSIPQFFSTVAMAAHLLPVTDPKQGIGVYPACSTLRKCRRLGTRCNEQRRLRRRKASQVVLGDDKPGWQLSSVLPTPTDDFSRYRGRLKEETSKYIKTSSLKLGTSEPGSQYKTSMAREGFRTPDPNTSTEEFNGNRVFHDKLKQAERTTGFIHPDAYTRVQYTRSNAMPDFTTRLHEAKYSPKAGRELMLQIRMSNILFGDGRIKTFTTTQHDSMDKVVEETKKSKVPLTIRVKQDPRSSSIKLGEAENEDQWTTSSKTPNWFDPEIYAIESTP